MKILIDDMLEEYFTNVLIKGQDAADEQLLSELKAGKHAEAILQVIKQTTTSYQDYLQLIMDSNFDKKIQ